jgi:hypothetical protein
MMTALSHLLPPLPSFTALARTYAPWPVWTGSTTQPVRCAPMPKKAAVPLCCANIASAGLARW